MKVNTTTNRDLNIKTILDIDLLYSKLGDAFYNTTNEAEDNTVTKQLLSAIRDHNITDKQIKMLLKGISKHMEDHRRCFYENGVILTSCIFKDKGFKLNKLSNYNEHKEIIFEILGEEKLEQDEQTTNELLEEQKIVKMPVKNKVKYLQQAIEILKSNEVARYKEVYENLKILIDRSSERTLKNSPDFIRTILIAEYDSYEKIEAIALFLIRNDSLLEDVLKEIFLNNYNVRNKIDIIFSLIVYIKSVENCNYQNILNSIENLKIDSFVHKVTEKYLNILQDELKKRIK
ncbi:hypothetical protein NGRA_0442 [Nosema granulosis]|uniref:Uncharacterized protein n=1 Tax=Nosema granulosis TaxID=83296 RepID=A0A9P6H0X4_9MICR|nr:hypothetical protein NGRA_0442 [Nosema granulosis]